MKSKWKVKSIFIGGITVYAVYRQIDLDAISYHEFATHYMLNNKSDAKDIAQKLNDKEMENENVNN